MAAVRVAQERGLEDVAAKHLRDSQRPGDRYWGCPIGALTAVAYRPASSPRC
jgi:hypothetical protein